MYLLHETLHLWTAVDEVEVFCRKGENDFVLPQNAELRKRQILNYFTASVSFNVRVFHNLGLKAGSGADSEFASCISALGHEYSRAHTRSHHFQMVCSGSRQNTTVVAPPHPNTCRNNERETCN